MFKPLLKTIPSLSGNMKIVCNLEGYEQDSSNSFIYNCNVNSAWLTSISSNLYDKNIKINLKNNSFEYDVKNFYLYYANVFYSTNFKYSKINIPIIDFSSKVNNNNQDFKYGCKRISYLKSNNQFAFFAPIYIESLDDIKGKYFVITCTFNKTYKLTKHIKVKISNTNEHNYLADYLCRYASKIDDKVIYCSNSYKNIYYGIDVKNGGLIKVEDNISSNLYNKYFTINDFDATINNGFKRNYMMMKQILALSFYFDPQNLLYDFEKKIYNNSEIIISGQWYDENDNKIDFYDFSDDYSIYKEDILNLYYKNSFNYVETGNNIMDIKYPASNEASSENYRYVNTVSKNYNRWKLKYSDDDHPYIINNNYAFSYNQQSLYLYKEFPAMYSSLRAYAKLVSNTEYNMLFDHEDIYDKDDVNILNKKEKYYELYNNKYITNFFNLLIKKDESDQYINIFNSQYNDFWTNVDKDGKVYHKGILYDLNSVYNENINNDIKIDKFGIFVHPEFSYTLGNEFNDEFKESKFVFTYDFSDINKIYNYYEIKTKSSYILNNVLVKKNPQGDYVDVSYLNNLRQYENNVYYDLNDIIIMYYINDQISYWSDNDNDGKIDKQHKYNLEFHDLSHIFTDTIYDKTISKEVSLDIIDGYKVIDIYNISNIYDDYFENLIYLFNEKNKRNDDGIIFRDKKFIEIEDFYWTIDKIYFSIYPNKTKYSLIENYKLLKEYKDTNTQIVLYFKTRFIKDDENTKNYFELKLGYDINNRSIYDTIFKNEILNVINKYYYVNGLYNKKDKILYTSFIFKQINDIENTYGNLLTLEDKNIIYVDPYNISRIYKNYLGIDNKQFDDSEKETFYCLFLNLDHIRLYFEKLYLDEHHSNSNYADDEKNPIRNIYVKIRNFNNIKINLNDHAKTDISTLTINDEFIPITEFGIGSIAEIIDYISYDEKYKCFFFNDRYDDAFIKEYRKIISIYEENELESLDINNDLKQVILTLNKYKIEKFELCFKKKMLKLNEDLYNLIIARTNDDIFKDLYLYHIYDPIDYRCPMNYVNIKYVNNYPNENILKILKNENNDDSNIKIHQIDKVLYPYFNDVYNENQTETKIYSDYFINNIISCIDNSVNPPAKRYRYNVSSIDMLAYIPNNNNYNDYRYSLVNDVQDRFITASEFREMNIVNNPENINELYGIITYNYNDVNYGFYIINSYFDNTKNTLNIQNEDLDYINCVDYIDNINVKDVNTYSYSYLGTIYKNIMPYFSVTNPIKYLINNATPLIKPQMYKLKNNIKQYPNIENNKVYSYTLYHNNKKSFNIELLRYFDNIVPYIPKLNYLNSYYLYYKNTNNFIEYDLDILHSSYIMYRMKSNLNDPLVVSYYDVDKNIYKYEPTEFKNYNYNKFYNLEKEIIIEIERLFTENELIEYENNKDNIFNLFVNYMNINKFNDMSNIDKVNNYLFLYKKYSVSFIKDYKYINDSNNKVYSLKIKFSLL